MAQVFQLAGEVRTAAISMKAEVRTAPIALAGEVRTAAISMKAEVRTAPIALAGEVRTAAHRFDVVVSSGYTFLRDVNGALILDVNGTPIPVFG